MTMRLASALLLLLVVAGPAAADVGLCQKGIDKAGAKLEKLLTKNFGKCADLYRKAAAGGSMATAAAGCNVQLAKTITFPDPSGASAMQQAKNALADLATTSCTDGDLLALGHLPEGTFGDRWQRTLLIARLAGAYGKLVDAVQDARTAFRAMSAAGGCPLCAKLVQSPCVQQSCGLGPGSNARAFAPAQFPIAISGETVVDLCRDDDVLANEYVIVGRAAKTIVRTSVATSSLCTRIAGTEGVIGCAGSTVPKVGYTACRDHIVNAPDVDECAGSGVLCDGNTVDLIPEHAGTTNGGACVGLNAASPATGSAFALTRIEITLVSSTQRGPDGVACTADDTAPAPIGLTVPLTTATAQGFLFDAVDSPGNGIAPAAVTGAAFSCPALPGSLAGGQLVGAANVLHALCLTAPCDDPNTAADEGNVAADAVITFGLVCQ